MLSRFTQLEISFRIIFLSFLFLSDISCHSNSDTQSQKKYDGIFAVKKKFDGDTFWIYNGTSEGEKIRLIGADAPESKSIFKKKKGYFGTEVQDYMLVIWSAYAEIQMHIHYGLNNSLISINKH